MKDSYAVVDIETTGSSPKNGDRIIQIGIVRIEQGSIVSTYSTFVNPEKQIPTFIQQLTHISNEDVKDAPLFHEIVEEVYSQLEGAIFVAHNVNFDFPFLQGELKRVSRPLLKNKKIDTVEFSRLMFPSALSYKLSEITSELGIELTDAHRADADAYATAELFLSCIRKLNSLSLDTITKLHQRCFRMKSHVAPLFFEAMRMQQQRLSEPVQEETIQPAKAFPDYPVSEEQKLALLQEIYSTSQHRPSQLNYMDAVHEALQNRSEVALEAETGIGKTMGYLIPAIRYALETNQKVVISTYTNTLMDQLIEKECTQLLQAFPGSFHVSRLKAYTHYIDHELFQVRLASEDESYDETFALMQLLVWLQETKSGDLTELNTTGGGALTLDKVRKRKRTPHIAQDFYEMEYRRAKQAQLIITNHAMVAGQPEVMKSFESQIGALIIDEAHHFLTAVKKMNEKVISFTEWKYLFSQFGFNEKTQVGWKLEKLGIPSAILNKLKIRTETIQDVFDGIIRELIELTQAQKTARGMSKVTVDLRQRQALFEDFIAELNSLVKLYDELLYTVDISTTLDKEDITYWIRELRIVAYKWEEFVMQIQDEASWLEADKRSLPSSFIFHQRKLNHQEFTEQLFENYRATKSIVWTSGTLTVPKQPWFILDQLYLPRSIPIQRFHAAPDYYNGVKVFIVDDVPDVTQVDQMTFIESIADVIIQTAQVTEGRMFVLFTSQDMLRKTVELVEETSLADDFLLIAQGMNAGSKMRMLRTFQRFEKAILFGTTTFWEGVDVPGDALSTILLVRLPFTNPDDPYFKQKAEELTRNGQNAFTKLALPEAIIRFKQGFGRLIRNPEEKGAFIILDRRIETKSYGKDFLTAIPRVPTEHVSVETMVEMLETWYNS